MTHGPRRWHEQRWIIDSVLRTDGLEWDQPRVAYTLRPMGVDATADLRVAQSRIHKFADIAAVFTELAERRETLAKDRRSPAAAPMLVYQQGRHALSLPTPSVALGPNWLTYAADWLLDRAGGLPAEDYLDHVVPCGRVERRPHPKEADA